MWSFALVHSGWYDAVSLARWYYEMWAPDVHNLILLTGTPLRVPLHINCSKPRAIRRKQGEKVRYKVHQGWCDVEQMLKRISARHNVLVHTDIAETERLKQGLLQVCLQPGSEIDLLSPGDQLIF